MTARPYRVLHWVLTLCLWTVGNVLVAQPPGRARIVAPTSHENEPLCARQRPLLVPRDGAFGGVMSDMAKCPQSGPEFIIAEFRRGLEGTNTRAIFQGTFSGITDRRLADELLSMATSRSLDTAMRHFALEMLYSQFHPGETIQLNVGDFPLIKVNTAGIRTDTLWQRTIVSSSHGGHIHRREVQVGRDAITAADRVRFRDALLAFIADTTQMEDLRIIARAVIPR